MHKQSLRAKLKSKASCQLGGVDWQQDEIFEQFVPCLLA
jgi:hypothetical protein